MTRKKRKRTWEPLLARGVGWWVFTLSAWRSTWPAHQIQPFTNGGHD